MRKNDAAIRKAERTAGLRSLVGRTRIETEKKNRQTEDDYERAHYADKISVFEIDRHGAKVGFGNPSSG